MSVNIHKIISKLGLKCHKLFQTMPACVLGFKKNSDFKENFVQTLPNTKDRTKIRRFQPSEMVNELITSRCDLLSRYFLFCGVSR